MAHRFGGLRDTTSRRVPGALLIAVLVAGACSGGGDSGSSIDGSGGSSGGAGGSSSRPPRASRERPLTYVAIGASESVGMGAADPRREAWPRVLSSRSLPGPVRLVNLAIPGATVERARSAELPRAAELEPDLVTVWLNVNDLIQDVPVADYERQLTALLRSLVGTGAEVFVANTPPLDRLPAYASCKPNPPRRAPPCLFDLGFPDAINRVVARYNAAIQRAARRTEAVVVDLHSAGLRARARGDERSLVAIDGFHPSTMGHRAIARVFARTIENRDLSFD